jgi:hypothetical protein
MGGVPVNVASRTMELPVSTLKSANLFTKVAGSTRRKHEGKFISSNEDLEKFQKHTRTRDKSKPFTKRCVVQEALPASLVTRQE